MREHFVTVKRTARYLTLGKRGLDLTQVWFVCHGYRQLASRFIRYFAPIQDDRRYIVAPEGLSRFYVNDEGKEHGPGSKVGASWMTREDRLNEINDYVRYLDTIYDRVFEKVDRAQVSVTLLGFSQGVATASRWLEAGHISVDHLILWGGLLPPDVNVEGPIRDTRLTVVYGDRDDAVVSERIEAQESFLREHHMDHDLVRFQGGHHLNQFVLKDLAKEGAAEG